MVQETYLLGNQKEAYKNEILKNGIFESGTISGFLPAGGPWRYPKTWWPEGNQGSASITVQDWSIDQDYITTMGMEIKSGRDFSKEFISDTTAVIINETAALQFGIDNDALGKKVTTYKGTDPVAFRPDNVESFTVVGVVKDFHFASMKEAIGPLVLHLQKNPSGSIVFRFQGNKVQEAISLVEQQWRKMAPGEPFTYDFVDESFISFYNAEAQLGKIFASFTGTALLIASMGLFALVSFTTERRTKEIGIRKVMGASSANIVALLSKELGKLIMVAFLISVPLASYAVGWWLDDYVYKVDVGVTVYLFALCLALIVGWLTISYQSIKAANSNPAISLRAE